MIPLLHHKNSGYLLPFMQNMMGVLPMSVLVHLGLNPGGQTAAADGPNATSATGALGTCGADIGSVATPTAAVWAPAVQADRATTDTSPRHDLTLRMCFSRDISAQG